jgi:hypothetical protein
MKATVPEISAAQQDAQDSSWLDVVRQQVGSLRFGVVQIVVHESRIVQILQPIVGSPCKQHS